MGQRPALVIGKFYADVAQEHAGIQRLTMWKVLEVGEETIRVEDDHGEKRVVNRAVAEGDVASGRAVLASEHLKAEGRRARKESTR